MEIDLVQMQLEQAKVDLEMKKMELAKAKQHKVDNGNSESWGPEKKIDMWSFVFNRHSPQKVNLRLSYEITRIYTDNESYIQVS